jgi:hypothetical protein
MRNVRVFLLAVGVFYLLNFLGTLPFEALGLFDMMYPGMQVNGGLPLFTLLQDAWLAVGAQLAAIGVVALWGARDPARCMPVVQIVVATEVATGLWDLYSVAAGRMAPAPWLVLLIIHAAWIFWGVRVLKAGSPEPRAMVTGRST